MAHQVKVVREGLKISRRALARMSGVSHTELYSIEHEIVSPTERTLRKLAAALGVSILDLIDETKEVEMDEQDSDSEIGKRPTSGRIIG